MDGFPELSLQMCSDISETQAKNPSQRRFSPVSKDIILAKDERERQRLQTIESLGLMQTDEVTVFNEATQSAARFLNASICFLGIMERDRLWLRSAVGLSNSGAMSRLASARQIPRHESFCSRVLQSGQALVIENTAAISDYQHLALVTRYGIRAYLGVPLMSSSGDCVGTLAIMEQQARSFGEKDILFLEAIARWCMSEFERQHLSSRLTSLSPAASFPNSLPETATPTQAPRSTQLSLDDSNRDDLETDEENQRNPASSISRLCWVKANLIGHMVQELQTPLTSILGMTSVLAREIYGPLTSKQKEYMGIVHNSGQHLHSLVNEITDLGELDEHQPQVDLSPVDIEMLCQQALSVLQRASKRRDQSLHLTVEPGHRIWLLDKIKVRQILYHLIFRVIQISNPDSIVRVHISRKDEYLNIAIWTSHAWLGEGLPHSEFCAYRDLLQRKEREKTPQSSPSEQNGIESSAMDEADRNGETGWATLTELDQPQTPPSSHPQTWDAENCVLVTETEPVLDTGKTHRRNLGLLLSQALAEIHGGSISLQGSSESGYRYVISIPQVQDKDEDGDRQTAHP